MSALTLAELQAVSLGAWRHLLTPEYDEDDFQAALAEGLVWEEDPETRNPAAWSTGYTSKGTRYLAALRAVVDGLTEPQRRWLADFANGFGYAGAGGAVAMRSLESLGMVEPEAGCPTCGSVTHRVVVVHGLGHAALLLLEREDGEG